MSYTSVQNKLVKVPKSKKVTIIDSQFPLKWVASVLESSALPRQVVNQLERKAGEFYTASVADRLTQVNDINNTAIHDAVDMHIKKGKKFKLTRAPKFISIKLKNILIDEDIQRELNCLHISKIVKDFDERRTMPVTGVIFPGETILHCTDGQHTLVSWAKLAQAGLIEGVEADEWMEMELPCWYVETADRSFAREQFAFINGIGKLTIAEYDNHKQRVLSYRLDNNNKVEYAHSDDIQTIMEDRNIYPILETDKQNKGIPGTLTHLTAIKTLSTGCQAFIWDCHNAYWPHDVVDAAEIGLYKHLYAKADVPIDSPEYQTFIENFNSTIKEFFTDPAQLKKSVFEAWAGYTKAVHGSDDGKLKGCPNNASINVVLKIYQKIGGKFSVPNTVLSHTEAGHDLIDYLSPGIKRRINKVIKDAKDSA